MSIPALPHDPAPAQTLWFYADVNSQPVGPVPILELQRLSSAGVIHPESFVIEEGGSEWKPLNSILPQSAPAMPLPPSSENPAVIQAPARRGIRERRWPTLLVLFLFYPLGVLLLWRSKAFTKRGKLILVPVFGLFFLFAITKDNPPPSLSPDSTSAPPEAAQAAKQTPPLPSGPRYGIQRGGGGFADRDGVLELQKVKQSFPNEGEQSKALRELRLRHEKEGRRLDFTRDYVVRIVKEEPELGGFCEVIAEDAQGLKSPRFWVHKSMLQSSDSLFGSQIVTGYMVFEGNEGTEVGGADVSDLLDLLVAVYDGKISEAEARKCVFMPGAQSGERENVVGKYVIYQARYATWRELITFAMPIIDGNDDPLHTVPVRYAGREQFTTRGGLVRSIPVVVPHKIGD